MRQVPTLKITQALLGEFSWLDAALKAKIRRPEAFRRARRNDGGDTTDPPGEHTTSKKEDDVEEPTE